ncbi:MAG: glycoside hydrolase family 3 C-terminal domain-containing protein [Cyclobacteriaceae bacterium]
MRTKYIILKAQIVLASILLTACDKAEDDQLIYKDKNASIEDRIEDLIPRMTLEEKVLQMTQWTYGKNANPNNIEDAMKKVRPEIGSLIFRSTNPVYRNDIQRKAMEESRLGIPIINGFDAIHGYKTVFPIPLAQACSWDKELVKISCQISAKECWLAGVDWTFSPMVDVARDPRWGRVSEGYGEDPYANAAFAVAAIDGYQGTELSAKHTIAACMKHYIGYSLSEGGRDYHYSDVSDQTLWETFMPPYEAGIAAGATTVMSGFNDISGVPATGNYYTLTEVLKKKWGHDGFVVSDWGSIRNMVDQGVAVDRKEAGLKALKAGVDMDMVDDVYLDHLQELVEEGKVSMAAVDEAVRRILRIKFRLGLFDTPYVDELPEEDRFLQAEDLEFAEQMAAESMVLLKNENDLLPIKDVHQKIAVIGPMVEDSVHIMGFWEGQGNAKDVVSIREGIEKEFGGDKNLIYAKGCDFDGTDDSGFAEARKAAMSADIVLVFLGEKRRWSGENGIRSSIAYPDIQENLVNELKSTGKPIVLVTSSGRPLELIRLEPMADAILQMWQPGTMGGPAVAGVLSGRYNPSAKLAITFPQTTGQLPMHYNMRNPARPMGFYQDIPKEPMYNFGYGLSYTSFEYNDLGISKEKIKKNETLKARVEVSNTGNKDGKEAVLWFITDPVASISRPIKELKCFEKKQISPGEKEVFEFEIIPERDLFFYDKYGEKHVESGEYIVEVQGQKIGFELID